MTPTVLKSPGNDPACRPKPALADGATWVLVRVDTSSFAVPAHAVQTMVTLPKIVSMPKTPDYIRGVVEVRGRVMPVVDLRMRCGMEPLAKYTAELCLLFEQRQSDHQNWLNELEQSVADRRKFTLATDPHRCAFGKWYDAFQTSDRILAGLLEKFDEPHKAIHNIALQVGRFVDADDAAAAAALIAKTREADLAKLNRQFASTAAHLQTNLSREIAVVIECGHKPFALAVDTVEATERVKLEAVDEVPDVMSERCKEVVRGVARRNKSDQLVLLLDVAALFLEAGEFAGAATPDATSDNAAGASK